MGIDDAVAHLAKHGVKVKGSVIRSEPGNFVNLEDPDGNDIYLWEKGGQALLAEHKTTAMAEI